MEANDSPFARWPLLAVALWAGLLVGMFPAQSAFAQENTLTVTKAGGGSGTVITLPGGIACGVDCSAAFPAGSAIVLVPLPDPGSKFIGFSGAGSDCADLAVTMTTNKTCTASFALVGAPEATLTVTLQGPGTGTVTFAPPTLVCPPSCVSTVPVQTEVSLTVAAAAGSVFSGFAGSEDCQDGVVTVAATTLCTATFSLLQVVSVSVGPGGAPADGASLDPSISGDGRFVVFESTATNLAGACITGTSQIFLVDRDTRAITCLSVGPDGAPGDAASAQARISADGRVVAFQSAATNLVPAGCTTGGLHVFARDLATETTTCLSVTALGAPGDGASARPAISGDSRFVVFESVAMNLAGGCATGIAQIFLRDRLANATTCVSLGLGGLPGDGPSARAAVNGDGSVIAFDSTATNLVAVGCTTGELQIFVRAGGVTTCASVAPDGTAGTGASQGPALSANGFLVAFESVAPNLTATCQTAVSQIYVRNRTTGVTTCVSVTPDGVPGNGPSVNATISGDGTVVGFSTTATNLFGEPGGAAPLQFRGPARQAEGAAQIAITSLRRGDTQRVSEGNGSPGNGSSRSVWLNSTGLKIALDSEATNLQVGDTNGKSDVFAIELKAPEIVVPPPGLVAAVLPASRSVTVGTFATAFATMINVGADTAVGCSLALLTALPATFTFQTTDPATNQVIGTPDTPVNILAGGIQSFVFGLTPTGPIAPTDVQLSFACTNRAPAAITIGLNTLLFSASTTPIPDIVALAATVTNDGIVTLSGVPGTGAFSVATVNVGVGGAITASVDTGSAVLPVSLVVCQTDPATAECLAPPASTVTLQIDANATPTFGIFVGAGGAIPFNPAVNRVFVRFKDAGAVTRGATSVAVRTQ